MNIIFFLMPLALTLACLFLFFFVWSAMHGQFDDLETPAHRPLLDEDLNRGKDLQK